MSRTGVVFETARVREDRYQHGLLGLLLTQQALHLANILTQSAAFGGDVQESPAVPSPVQQNQTSRHKKDETHANQHSSPADETYTRQRRTIEGKESDCNQGQRAT